MRSQAFRRWKERVMKQKVKKYLYNRNLSEEDLTDRRIGKLATTPKPCSNPDCCGNPRRSRYAGYAPDLQEVKANIDLEEQIEEAVEEFGPSTTFLS